MYSHHDIIAALDARLGISRDEAGHAVQLGATPPQQPEEPQSVDIGQGARGTAIDTTRPGEKLTALIVDTLDTRRTSEPGWHRL